MTTRLLLAAVAATASFAVACGADENPPAAALPPGLTRTARRCSTTPPACARTASTCPTRGSRAGRSRSASAGPGTKINPDEMRAAQKACAKFQAKIEPPDLSDEEMAENKKAALANARCMRENGVPDFPDPIFDENGGAQIRIDKSLDPRARRSSGRWRRARRRCRRCAPRTGASDEARPRAQSRSWRRAAVRRPPRPRRRRRRARRRRSSAWTLVGPREPPRHARLRGPGTLGAGVAGTLTGLREPGTVITRGHSLYDVDGGAAAAFLLYGSVPAWRDFSRA